MGNVEVANLVITWPYINEMYSVRDSIHQLMHARGITVASDRWVIKARDHENVVLFNNKINEGLI